MLSGETVRKAPQPFVMKDDSAPEGVPGFKVSVKERLVKFDARGIHGVLPHTGERTSVVAYTVHTLDEPLSGSSMRLGFGSAYTHATSEQRCARSVAAWSIFTPLAESVLTRCSPHGDGPRPDSLRVRLTFCVHSGQLLERSFAPLEFLEFADPTDTLTVFLHSDLTKASTFAEQQLAEGELVDLYRGSTPGLLA